MLYCTFADISCRQSSFSAFFSDCKFSGRVCLAGAPDLFAAAIILDVNNIEKKSLFARYDECVMVQMSASDFPLKNLE